MNDTGQANADNLINDSKGALKHPSAKEIELMANFQAIYVNKWLCAVMKNNMVKIGFSVEHNLENSNFVSAVVTDVQSVANLHQLLTQLLTSFQQQQMKQIQEMQGKVNPQFLEAVKAMQENQKEG